MKVCPVCKARAFDDMEVCYGCLHRFGEEACESNLAGVESHVFAKSALEAGNAVEKTLEAHVSSANENRRKPRVEPIAPAAENPVAPNHVRAATPAACVVGEGRGAAALPAARNLVLNIPVPEGAAGVKVAVDFGVAGGSGGGEGAAAS